MANQISRNELIEKLRNVQGNAQLSKSVRDRITYTLAAFDKTPKQVTNSILSELANDIAAEIRALAEAQNEQSKAEEAKKPALVENSPKLKSKGKIKPTAKPVEEQVAPVAEPEVPVAEPEVAQVEEPVATEKPAEEKKPKSKIAAKGKAKSDTPKKDAPAKPDPVDHFPETLTHEALGELVSCKGKFLTIQEIRDYVTSDKTMYIAAHWSKKMLKQFEYGKIHSVKAPKEFPHDLDILTAVIVCDNVDRLWAMSVYTEAMMYFEGVDLVAVEGVRFSEGLEFEFYIPKSEAAE